jgi:hypothetical protein
MKSPLIVHQQQSLAERIKTMQHPPSAVAAKITSVNIQRPVTVQKFR